MLSGRGELFTLMALLPFAGNRVLTKLASRAGELRDRAGGLETEHHALYEALPPGEAPLMPVTTEENERKPKRGRGWLALPLGLLALLLLAGIALVVRPVSLAAGGHVLLIYWHRSSAGTPRFLNHTQSSPPAGQRYTTTGPDGLAYWIEGPQHYFWLDVAGRQFEVRWFKGRRVK